MERITIGTDHAGFALKEKIVALLADHYAVTDVSPECVPGDDYPLVAQRVCERILRDGGRGILLCDTGIGMSIAANRYRGIRAAVVTTVFMAQRTREHNHANVLCLGAAVVSDDINEALVEAWLRASASDEERHERRVAQLDMLG